MPCVPAGPVERDRHEPLAHGVVAAVGAGLGHEPAVEAERRDLGVAVGGDVARQQRLQHITAVVQPREQGLDAGQHAALRREAVREAGEDLGEMAERRVDHRGAVVGRYPRVGGDLGEDLRVGLAAHLHVTAGDRPVEHPRDGVLERLARHHAPAHERAVDIPQHQPPHAPLASFTAG